MTFSAISAPLALWVAMHSDHADSTRTSAGSGGAASLASAARNSASRGGLLSTRSTCAGMSFSASSRLPQPVLMLTGWGKRLLAENDIPAHVDRVLSKPPRLGELRAALAKLVPPADPADTLVESA